VADPAPLLIDVTYQDWGKGGSNAAFFVGLRR
jgi:hypothetical protein